jgi:hypothetical protein
VEPSELHSLVFACLGPRPALGAREHTVGLLKGARRCALRYEWVVDWPRLDRTVIKREEVALSDGQEWFTLTLVR